MLCVCYIGKNKSNMCYVYVTWCPKLICVMCIAHGDGQINNCYVFVTIGKTNVICVLCILHEEGKKLKYYVR
jgi:hypothetical protein